MPGIEIADVVALAGGAHEGACAAAQAGAGKIRPLFGIELFHQHVAAPAVQREVFERQAVEDFANGLLGRVRRGIGAFFEEGLGGFRQRLALFALRLPIECVAVDPAGHVALRRGRVDAIGVAEAGFRRARAGDGNDGAVFAARGIARVCRLGKEHAIQHVQRAHVAGAGAEEHERLIRLFRHADGDVLAFHFEVYDVLRLREERVLGAVHGLQHVQPQGFLQGSRRRNSPAPRARWAR